MTRPGVEAYVEAYASSHAFIGRAQLQGITYHRETGVKLRTYVGA